MDEFLSDMDRMFQGWIDDNGKEHKYYSTFLAIRDRFNKNIARAQQRLEVPEGKKTDADTASLF